MIKWLRTLLSRSRNWQEVERFDPTWRERISLMARHIAPGDGIVADLGCGPMWLKEFLPRDVHYIGVDYRYRGEGCIVCNLDTDDFPELDATVYFVSGCLEYMSDPDALIRSMATRSRKCIVSYCGLEHFSNLRERASRGWKNHLLDSDIVAIFSRYGMQRISSELTSTKNAVFVFVRDERPTQSRIMPSS